MSHRAIERLRRERESQIPSSTVYEDDSDEDDEEDGNVQVKKPSVFSAAMFHDDSDSDSDSDSDDDSDGDSDDGSESAKSGNTDAGINHDSSLRKNYEANTRDATIDKDEESPSGNRDKNGRSSDVEDLDALLEQYKLQDEKQEANTTTNNGDLASTQYSVITSKMDIRDLDIEFGRRALFGGIGVGDGESGLSSRRTHRHHHIFGTPGDNSPRPPHYVGGGIGFKTYADDKECSSQTLPWPYCDNKEGEFCCPPPQNWCEFIHSDSYKRDYEDMQIIKDSGDANAMVLFIAHHPYVVEALLQISIVMYQMDKKNEGLSFLKRALWIFECAAPNSFLKVKDRCALMDHRKEGNKAFFSTLFFLIRVSYIGGLSRTALAVSQLLISLDPLRDPKNVLLSIDHFALMSNTESSNLWLVDFVESKEVYVAFRDDENQEEFQCQLLDLPNWKFSYALALFNLCNDKSSSTDFAKERADGALKNALSRFPSVAAQLLAKSEIDTTSRSVRIDWPSAMIYLNKLACEVQDGMSEATNYDSFTRARTSQANETIVRIFVQQNCKLWSSSIVSTWIYDNLMTLQEERKNVEGAKVRPLSPAIIRYLSADTVDYDDKFQTMPADADPFDPNIIAHALNIDPNRRRLVQRNPRHVNANFVDENRIDLPSRDRNFFGPATEIIDPDEPILEVFWRSLLPWAHVEGVPPPNR
eukprot:CAMPEP_0197173116 /NCGR_PEP_ID=MMETSP1423-20130617/160_1 /TAXON_ID=476441 /ORGANISM="Pseudo-nitzschia heimii, Strain UNC1101" /LENGTH=699 /DNA_ID=CAMNT_0042621877 /DNA_START=210 /DNA_END=2309 /DNA_ORIENTATION=-